MYINKYIYKSYSWKSYSLTIDYLVKVYIYRFYFVFYLFTCKYSALLINIKKNQYITFWKLF